MMRMKKISKISAMHYVKLIIRSVLFFLASLAYVFDKLNIITANYYVLGVVWIFYIVEMIFRFFPNSQESMGCQKQFKRNYIKTDNNAPSVKQQWYKTFFVFIVWIALNAIIDGLYFMSIIDKEILILISLAFSVCDIICILFFCPFQTWIMHNRCCTTCRIYNWDFIMMFTPLVFIPSIYTYSLLFCALLLLIRWEVTYKIHPERFLDNTNKSLHCINCKEKLCKHKKQLQAFLIKYQKRFFKKNNNSQNIV